MTEIKGNRLIVNLGAAQARKRLKGVGYGAKKVQTGGKNQAVIIHTALGRNLEALKSLFADVGYKTSDHVAASEGGGRTVFAVGDIVIDVAQPELGNGVVVEDKTLRNSPTGEQCLTIDFEKLGRVIVFTAKRILEKVGQ